MLTKKDILKIILLILCAVAFVFLIVWVISKICPILIGAVVFIPWLVAALKDGADV